MGFRYGTVRQSQVRQCRDCQADIFFVKNRNDKWFAVDVYYDQRFRSLVYRHSGGAYNNLTPWHQCKGKRDYQLESLVCQAQLCIRTLCLNYLAARRENPSLINDERWARVMERANNRAIRRIALLPEGSKAWLSLRA